MDGVGSHACHKCHGQGSMFECDIGVSDPYWQRDLNADLVLGTVQIASKDCFKHSIILMMLTPCNIEFLIFESSDYFCTLL